MQVRKFKPGDRVRHRYNGRVMEVLKYVQESRPFVGKINTNLAECVWYENGQRKCEAFPQHVLTLASIPAGLFPTWLKEGSRAGR